MKNIIEPTWKNIIICIVIFYIIGDILLGVRMFINKEIKEYKRHQIEKRMEEYEREYNLKY